MLVVGNKFFFFLALGSFTSIEEKIRCCVGNYSYFFIFCSSSSRVRAFKMSIIGQRIRARCRPDNPAEFSSRAPTQRVSSLRTRARADCFTCCFVCSPFCILTPGRCIDRHTVIPYTRILAYPTVSEASICTCENKCITERMSTSICVSLWMAMCVYRVYAFGTITLHRVLYPFLAFSSNRNIAIVKNVPVRPTVSWTKIERRIHVTDGIAVGSRVVG